MKLRRFSTRAPGFESKLAALTRYDAAQDPAVQKAVRKILERAGIADILTKNYGSTNAVNVVKATMMALSKLRNREQTVALRGVNLE